VFDQKTLETHSRGHGTVTADGDLYTMSFIGHATDDELLSTLSASEIYGGSANRMLWVRAHPGRPLPFEERAPESIFERYRDELGVSKDAVPPPREMPLARSAEPEWERMYMRESEQAFGLYGVSKARGPINILRLATNIASSVHEPSISLEALLAADAIWQYCRQTAWLLFGLRSGDDQVDALITALVEVYADVNQDPWLATKEARNMLGPRYAVVSDRALTTGLVARRMIPAVDREGRPKRGRPSVFHMLSDFAVDQMRLPARKEDPMDGVDLGGFED